MTVHVHFFIGNYSLPFLIMSRLGALFSDKNGFLITYVSGMFNSLILHYGLEYSYTLTFDMTTGNLNGFTVECEYNVDWSG